MISPRIAKIEAKQGTVLRFLLKREKAWRQANLSGLVSRYAVLEPLKDESLFAKARIIDWGAGVGWPGERDIYAGTLVRLSEEQARFSNTDFRAWQSETGLSNSQTADVLGVSLGTVKNYRSAGEIPAGVAIACRAMRRDPAVLAARLTPRKTGRPKAA
jgi:Protein of unknown function (DUF2442)